MEKIVECVPNFSEGREAETLARIAAAADSVAGVAVLDTHADADHNRSVVTFVGDPASVVEAAVRACRAAVELIDLRRHAGQHPRVGALDVLPFVPVRGVTLEECVHLAHEAGERIWRELRVPVYFYESAARRPDRVNLEDVRRGGFEQLREEIGRVAERAPDVGEPRLHESAGACVVGARSFLIAYNINLRTDDQQIARRIAAAVRGRNGGLRYLKALGFALPERGMTQVSMNVVRFEKTQLHHVFEAVRREAERWGVSVAGSEIVGLVPQAALDRAAEFYLRVENFSPEVVLENRIASAVAAKREAERGGRGDAGAADEEAQIEREELRRERESKAAHAAALMSDPETAPAAPPPPHPAAASPAPPVPASQVPASEPLVGDVAGGGAAAAQAAALAAALGEMVARLVARKSRQEDAGGEAAEALQELSELRARLDEAVEEDEAAFAEVLASRRMPRGTEEERRARAVAVESALKGAANVPLEVARRGVQVAEILETLAELGDPGWLSDAATGAQLALAAVTGARYNVLVNVAGLGDEEFAAEHRGRADDLLERARGIAARVESMLVESVG